MIGENRIEHIRVPVFDYQDVCSSFFFMISVMLLLEVGNNFLRKQNKVCYTCWKKATWFYLNYEFSRCRYFGPKIIFIPPPPAFLKWYFSSSHDMSVFNSYHALFAFILPNFEFILPFCFQFSLFLSPFSFFFPLSSFFFPLSSFFIVSRFLFPFSYILA